MQQLPRSCNKAYRRKSVLLRNEPGKCRQERQDRDLAIACREQSMACQGKPGFAQVQLMEAGNAKRRARSQARDGAGVERHFIKIDKVMQNKEAIPSGF